MMDLAIILPWVSGLISIITLLTLLKNMLSSGEKKIAEDVAEVKKKLIEHDRRIQSVEAELKHLPDRETAHRLDLALAQISGRLDTLDERLNPIAATSRRLQEFLLEQAKK